MSKAKKFLEKVSNFKGKDILVEAVSDYSFNDSAQKIVNHSIGGIIANTFEKNITNRLKSGSLTIDDSENGKVHKIFANDAWQIRFEPENQSQSFREEYGGYVAIEIFVLLRRDGINVHVRDEKTNRTIDDIDLDQTTSIVTAPTSLIGEVVNFLDQI